MQNARFLAKSSLFKPPLGWLFRAWGGYPVDRGKSGDVVEQVAGIFKKEDHFILAIAPEGTGKKWTSSGPDFITLQRKLVVPIIPVGFDYKKKEVILGSHFIRPKMYTGHCFVDLVLQQDHRKKS